MSIVMSPSHALAVALVQEAGALALRFFARRDTLAMSTKGSLDFVSQADREVEQHMAAAIAEAFDGAHLYGEEGGGQTSDDYWIVDPIDGTSNFLRGSPLWGISLAHMTHSQPDIGVIHYPVLGITLSAETGGGLFVNGKPSTRDDAFGAARVVAVGENNRWEVDSIGQVERHFRMKRWGIAQYRCASISLGFAALGRTDGYVERFLSLWDLAAGVLICQEAGLESRWGGDAVAQGMWVAVGTSALMEDLQPISNAITG
ncbi:inositol monophosphatase family protein [Rhizobium sp.]|jgi:myo-inositol-1(or 4)-monophosphatase|uniref:inositol monophosphatase family protein n=1 Tax=Rhizobium sp. TaxID=391 RepID=UPI000E99CA4B|nr:inositol monophosphatase [Rhizobium sp.]